MQVEATEEEEEEASGLTTAREAAEGGEVENKDLAQ